MKTKDALINLKINTGTRDDLKAAASLRGLTVSALLHQFIVKTIREERERNEQAFQAALAAVRQAGQQLRVELEQTQQALPSPEPPLKARAASTHLSDRGGTTAKSRQSRAVKRDIEAGLDYVRRRKGRAK